MNHTDGGGQDLTCRHWKRGLSAWGLFIVFALFFISSECGVSDVDSTVKESRRIPEREDAAAEFSAFEYEEGVELFIDGSRVVVRLPRNQGVTESGDYMLYRRKWDERAVPMASTTHHAELDSQKEDSLTLLRMTILNQLASMAEGFNRELVMKSLQEICRVVANADVSEKALTYEGKGEVTLFFEDNAGALELRWEDNLLSLKVADYDGDRFELYNLNAEHEWGKIPESVVERLKKIRRETGGIP